MSRKLDTATTIRPSAFAHFVLRVSDLKASVAWYETVLGMRTVHDAGIGVFMTYDDEHHRVALLQTPITGEAPPGAPGLDHVAYTLATLHDLLGTFRRLKALDILPAWSINHGPTTSLYYADPDGNRIEFQVDNFETLEEAHAWMATDAFKANPIGVDFDPEKLVERYLNGDPLEELLLQGAA